LKNELIYDSTDHDHEKVTYRVYDLLLAKWFQFRYGGRLLVVDGWRLWLKLLKTGGTFWL